MGIRSCSVGLKGWNIKGTQSRTFPVGETGVWIPRSHMDPTALYVRHKETAAAVCNMSESADTHCRGRISNYLSCSLSSARESADRDKPASSFETRYQALLRGDVGPLVLSIKSTSQSQEIRRTMGSSASTLKQCKRTRLTISKPELLSFHSHFNHLLITSDITGCRTTPYQQRPLMTMP